MSVTYAWSVYGTLTAAVFAAIALLAAGLFRTVSRLDLVINRVGAVGAEFSALRGHIQMVGRTVEVVGHRLDALEHRLDGTDGRLQAMQVQLSADRGEVLGRLDTLTERITRRPGPGGLDED